MVDPTPTPAAAAPADPTIKLPDGTMQPLSRIVTGFQQYSAKEQEAMASAQKAQKLEAQLQGITPDAAAYRNLQALIAKDPEAAKSQFDRIVRMAMGDTTPAQANTSAASDAKLEMKVAELSAQLSQLQATEMGRAQVAEIREAMKEIPVFQNSAEAKRLGESFVATLRAQNPDLSIKQAVESVHQDFQKLLNGQTAQVVQARTELAQSGAVPPAASAATPGMTAQPTLGAKSMKDGTARAALEKLLMASIQGGATT